MSKIEKTLSGYSGSEVLLISDGTTSLVRKTGNVARNIEQYQQLSSTNISMPRLLDIGTDHYDMEYVRHTDMVSWLLHNPTDQLIRWIVETIAQLQQDSVQKDYSSIYASKLHNPNLDQHWINLPFTVDELLSRLPVMLESSNYHGDFTMDNFLHGADGRFYLIDPITTEYDSWIFDVVKLMQDLDCGWFIRSKPVLLHGKLWTMRKAILKAYPAAADPHLLILMLLRILPYARSTEDTAWIHKEINRLWT